MIMILMHVSHYKNNTPNFRLNNCIFEFDNKTPVDFQHCQDPMANEMISEILDNQNWDRSADNYSNIALWVKFGKHFAMCKIIKTVTINNDIIVAYYWNISLPQDTREGDTMRSINTLNIYNDDSHYHSECYIDV